MYGGVRSVVRRPTRVSLTVIGSRTPAANGGDTTCLMVTHAPLISELQRAVPSKAAARLAFRGVPSTSAGRPLGTSTTKTTADRWPQREAERQGLLAACALGSADVLVCNLFSLDVLALGEALGVPVVVVSPFWSEERCPLALLDAVRTELPDLAAALDTATAATATLSWPVVEHWLWRTLLDDLGEWRERALGLNPCPFVDALAAAGGRLPPAPPLVYTLCTRLMPPAWRTTLANLTAAAPQAIHVVGPLTTLPSGSEDHEEEEEDDNDMPTVYVGLGSMEAGGQLDAADAALLLGALVGAVASVAPQRGWPPRVLVVAHSPDPDHAPLAAAAAAAATSAVMVRPRRGPVRDLAEWLRARPRLAVAVHHGGAGTVVDVARAGVPQLIVPFHYDQPAWGAAVVAAGAGAVLPRDWRACSSATWEAALAQALAVPRGSRDLNALAADVTAECDGALDRVAAIVRASVLV
jgi:hypothetical protein